MCLYINLTIFFIYSNPPLSYWNTHVDIFHDFVDEVFRWALVNDKPEILLDTLSATNRDLYSINSILLILSVSSTTSERSLSGRRLVKSYLRSRDKRLSNLYTDMCKSTWIRKTTNNS